MALRANHDSHALSLVVELNHDGSIIPSSIEITPSIVHVDYRLSYDEVDEMLEQGTAYFEEWEIGALLSEANKRRKYRMAKGSSEEFVPKPIPQAEVNVVPDVTAEDNLDIKVDIEVSHNAGLNHSSLVATLDTAMTKYCSPLSPAFLLVTEMMVLAGEALGLWAQYLPNQNEYKLRLPYRSQGRPDYAQRQDEFDMLETLKHVGHGYCHAWYVMSTFSHVSTLGTIP
jgi:exoribonuclease R